MIRNKKRISNMPHSIDSAAKALDLDRDNIITLLLDGSIRACINYRTEFSHSLTIGVVFLRDYIDVIGQYKAYLNDENSLNCPLSKLLSTPHSTISNAHSLPHNVTYNSIPLSADLKGLWHIGELSLVAELYENRFGYTPTLVAIIPYISDSIYNSDINEKMDNFVECFFVEASFDDIYISYDDIKRIDTSLNSNKELEKIVLVRGNICLGPIFRPIEQLAMAFVQLIESDENLGERYIETPHSSLQRIENVRKRNKQPQLEIDNRSFCNLILTGKKLLKSNPNLDFRSLKKPVIDNNKKKPRSLSEINSKTFMQLISSHSFFSPQTIENFDDAYELIIEKLNLNMEAELFNETLKIAEIY